VGRDRAYVYSNGPFSSRWVISDDGDGLFWGSAYFESFLAGRKYHDILYEVQGDRTPQVYLSRQFNQIRHSEMENSGEATITAIVSAKNAKQVAILHVTNAVKWTATPKTFSGISVIGTSPESSALSQLVWHVTAPERIIAAAQDSNGSGYAALVTEYKTRKSGDKEVWIKPADLYIVDDKHQVQRVCSLKSPSVWPTVLYSSSISKAVTVNQDGDIAIVNVKIGKVQTMSPPRAERNAKATIHNLAWDGHGRVFVSFFWPDKKPTLYSPDVYRMYLLDLHSGQWRFVGPYGLLGSSHDGKYISVSSPKNKEAFWILKAKGN
jgi:hypothetical protein